MPGLDTAATLPRPAARETQGDILSATTVTPCPHRRPGCPERQPKALVYAKRTEPVELPTPVAHSQRRPAGPPPRPRRGREHRGGCTSSVCRHWGLSTGRARYACPPLSDHQPALIPFPSSRLSAIRGWGWHMRGRASTGMAGTSGHPTGGKPQAPRDGHAVSGIDRVSRTSCPHIRSWRLTEPCGWVVTIAPARPPWEATATLRSHMA